MTMRQHLDIDHNVEAPLGGKNASETTAAAIAAMGQRETSTNRRDNANVPVVELPEGIRNLLNNEAAAH